MRWTVGEDWPKNVNNNKEILALVPEKKIKLPAAESESLLPEVK